MIFRDGVMSKFDIVHLSDEVDAADAACSPVQTEAYNQLYNEWRYRDGNLFSFRGKLNQNLHTYEDGMGVQENAPAKRERRALWNTCLLITGVVLIYALVENVLVLPLMLLFKAFGVEVSYSFNDSIAYGNQYAVLCVLLFESLLKHLLPILLVHKQVKMPKEAAYPLKIQDKCQMGMAMGAMFTGFFITSFLRQFFPMEIFNASNIGMTYEVISYMDVWCSTLYVVFELVITSILAEILFHGMLFQTLRQFGAGFAIVVIAALNTTMMHDPISFATVFVTSIAAGYGVWMSGSLLTGIMVHMGSRCLNFILFQSEKFPNLGLLSGTMCFIFAVLLVGILCQGLLHLFFPQKHVMQDYRTFLPMKEKVKTVAYSGPMLVSWGLCFILMLIEIFT